MGSEHFWEVLTKDDNFPVFCTFAFLLIGGIVFFVTMFWYQIEKVRAETDLKRSMVERGMSVEEIERVLAAKSPDAGVRRR